MSDVINVFYEMGHSLRLLAVMFLLLLAIYFVYEVAGRLMGRNLKTDWAKEFWSTARSFLGAILFALFVHSFLYQPFNIPSRSMVPTFLVGDYLLVSKFSYGYSRYSIFPGLPLFKGRILEDAPEQGDVIVFRHSTVRWKDYIKRVIGVPGDTVQVIGGMVYLNGQPLERRQVDAHLYDPENGPDREVKQYVEILPNGRSYNTLDLTNNGPGDNTPAFTVPEDHYFVMGDNRDNSLDSRFPVEKGGIGFVHKDFIIGRADIILMSLKDAPFWQVWKWPSNSREGRFFRTVERDEAGHGPE